MKKSFKNKILALLLVVGMIVGISACGLTSQELFSLPDSSDSGLHISDSDDASKESEKSYADAEDDAEDDADRSTVMDTAANASGKHFDIGSAAAGPNKKAISVADIYKKASPSVVAVRTSETGENFFGETQNLEGSGSGVIISEDGYILTCNHVVKDSDKIIVEMHDGKELEAKFLGGDVATDLAVIKIEAKGLRAVQLGDSDKLEIGEIAIAIGNPLGAFANSLTAGFISGKDRAIPFIDEDGTTTSLNLLQTDASISPGNSGGGLFDSYGDLIGITSSKSLGNGVEGIGFAIPVNDAKAVINDLANDGYVTRPAIGIVGMTISADTSEAYKMPTGVYVTGVVEKGAADEAGLVIGDIITKVDGKAISGIEELTKIKNSKKIGDKIKFTVDHDGEEREVTITLKQEVQATSKPEPSKADVPDGLPDVFKDYFDKKR